MLKCVLWLKMYSVLVNVPCDHEKNVYFLVGWSHLKTSIYIQLMVLLSSVTYFLIFCLLDLFISSTRLLYSPDTLVESSVSLKLYQFLPQVVWPSVRHIHIKDCDIFLVNWSLYHYVMYLSILDYFFQCEVGSVWN